MKQFENRVQFQGSAKSQGFDPVNAPDSTPLLRQNMQTSISNLNTIKEFAQSQGLANMEASNLSNLAAFSETLSTNIVNAVKAKNARDEEEGYMWAYNNGLSDELTKQFEQQEADLLRNEANFKQVASEVEASGAPVDVVKQFRNLGGWKAYGAAKALAEQAATAYPTFYSQASENTSVVINGQEVTLSNAKSGPERAAVEELIRRQYIQRFVGLNPALLNKYLFPAMRQFEARQAVEWTDTQRTLFKEERKAEAQDFLYNGIKSGNGGQALINFIQQYSPDFGGLGNTRKVGIDILKKLIESRQITESEVNALLDHQFQAKDGSTTTVGTLWGRDFTEVKDLLYNASRTDLQQTLQRQQDQAAEFKLVFDQQTSERKAQGREWTEAELREVSSNYESLGLGPAPDWLKNYSSKEDRVRELDKERLLKIRQSRGYLTEEDLRNIDATLYQEMIGYVKADKALSEAPQSYKDEAKTKIAALSGRYHNLQDATKEKTPEYYNSLYNALRKYDTYFAENVRQGDTVQIAHDKAMKRVEENFDKGTYTLKPATESNLQHRSNLKRASEALSKDANLVNTRVLPGTEKDLIQLENYAKTGRGSIPLIYHQLASGNRNLTAWDIANAQLQAAGKPGLVRTPDQEFVDRQDPQLRRLLTWRPTAARTYRLISATDAAKPLLDLIASNESKGYGEYDAMNRGGSHGGTVAYGSANSKDALGRGLSTMSVQEVVDLQSIGKVHAAGRYQIIGSTLKDLVKNGVVKPTDRFDANTQDKLAISLARRRITSRNALTGLRNEWIGLGKVSDSALTKAVQTFNAGSPFNQPENLLPRLVYRIGSLGYGSTGPHLDVKPVTPGTLQTNSKLPSITKSELDQYVVVGSRQLPLSQGTTTTDTDTKHRNRGSFGHDFAADDGTPVFLKNGARVVGTYKGEGGTDHTIVELPDGRRYQFLHGTNA